MTSKLAKFALAASLGVPFTASAQTAENNVQAHITTFLGGGLTSSVVSGLASVDDCKALVTNTAHYFGQTNFRTLTVGSCIQNGKVVAKISCDSNKCQ